MRSLVNVWAVLHRELVAFFLSPVAWVVLFLFVLSNGFAFYHYVNLFAGEPQQITLIVRSLFSFAFFWILPLSPLLTMRLFAEEKRTGTLETLMTAPVTARQVVLGKFLAAQLFYMVVWSSLLLFCLVLDVLGRPNGPDWGPIVSNYVGLFFLGTLTNSLGVLASTMSRNQLVAAVLALSGNLFFFSLVLGSLVYPDSVEVRRIFHFLSFTTHFKSEYTQGIVDVRYPLYYMSFMALFLFFAGWVVETRKWR